MEEHDVMTTKELPGTLVVFMIGQTCMNLEATGVVETKTVRSAPSYPDVIPKQKVIKQEERGVDDRMVGFLVKAYLPDVLVVEASVEVDSILADTTLELQEKACVPNAEGSLRNLPAIRSLMRNTASTVSRDITVTLRYTCPFMETGSSHF